MGTEQDNSSKRIDLFEDNRRGNLFVIGLAAIAAMYALIHEPPGISVGDWVVVAVSGVYGVNHGWLALRNTSAIRAERKPHSNSFFPKIFKRN